MRHSSLRNKRNKATKMLVAGRSTHRNNIGALRRLGKKHGLGKLAGETTALSSLFEGFRWPV